MLACESSTLLDDLNPPVHSWRFRASHSVSIRALDGEGYLWFTAVHGEGAHLGLRRLKQLDEQGRTRVAEKFVRLEGEAPMRAVVPCEGPGPQRSHSFAHRDRDSERRWATCTTDQVPTLGSSSPLEGLEEPYLGAASSLIGPS